MITKILKACDCSDPTVKEICVFIADYGASLLASGATCIRLDKNVSRIAKAYGMEAEMTVMPRHIHLTMIDERNGEIQTSITTVPNTCISFAINTELSRLSWAIADEKISFLEAVDRYNTIINNDRQNRWLVLLLVVMANASFCCLFGGDIIAMTVVGLATLAGYYTKTYLLGHKVDARLVFIICSFISSVIGATDMLFSLGSTPDIALGTSVLYLVPGIPYLNSFSDMLYRRYLSAFARFFDAVVLTICLSMGLCAGMLLMHANMF